MHHRYQLYIQGHLYVDPRLILPTHSTQNVFFCGVILKIFWIYKKVSNHESNSSGGLLIEIGVEDIFVLAATLDAKLFAKSDKLQKWMGNQGINGAFTIYIFLVVSQFYNILCGISKLFDIKSITINKKIVVFWLVFILSTGCSVWHFQTFFWLGHAFSDKVCNSLVSFVKKWVTKSERSPKMPNESYF